MLDLHRRRPHPHLRRGRLDNRLAVGEDAHPRLYRKAEERIVSGGDALADQPLAVALRSWLGVARIPPEFFRALAVRLRQTAAGERRVFGGILRGLVDPPQLDRIHAQRIGQFVHRRFQRERSNGFARSAHPGIGDRIQIDDLLLNENIGRRVEVPGRERCTVPRSARARWSPSDPYGAERKASRPSWRRDRSAVPRRCVRQPPGRLPSRDKDSFTGRFNALAAAAQSGVWFQSPPLPPKPPPTKGAIT